MGLFSFIIDNKEILKLFYGLIISLICLIIVIKSDRLFRISLHKGIRYFRNAFLFYTLAFISRYILGANLFYNLVSPDYHFFVGIAFEFFIITAGFFLLYSLLWKKIESVEEDYKSSLLNTKIILFYLMAIVLVILDFSWKTFVLMFTSQIITFSLATAISYINYIKNKKGHKFPKFYFVAMVLSLIAWVLNALSALYLNWTKGILIDVYVINILTFLLFLYGVIIVTKK